MAHQLFLNSTKFEKEEFDLERAFAIGQHHDGITGTHAQFVQDDYVKKFDQARAAVFNATEQIFKSNFGTPSDVPMVRCDYLNATICSVTEKGGNITVGGYNPSGWSYHYPIRIPVRLDNITAVHIDNQDFDLIPLSKTELTVRGNRGNATHQMLLAPKLTANDLTTTNISITEFTNQKPPEIPNQDSHSLVNSVWNITYNENEFEIKRIREPNGTVHYLNISVIWYNSSFDCLGCQSDAYTFDPFGKISHSTPLTQSYHTNGKLFDQVELVFDFVSIVLR